MVRLALPWLEVAGLPDWRVRRVVRPAGESQDIFLAPGGEQLVGKRAAFQFLQDNFTMEEARVLWRFSWISN